ncbi:MULTISPECIES: protein TolQ [Pseudomonas syringae group]|uniref:protein TolQ n=1 Tax=Pseudomonas syringae group TaxID=136849 RepID=UPI000F03DD1C
MQSSMSIVSLIKGASPVAQTVMFILLLASAVSWLLIFLRSYDLRRDSGELADFERRFHSGADLNQLYKELPDQPGGAGKVFRDGFRHFCQLTHANTDPTVTMDAVGSALRLALSREGMRLNRRLVILATISSVSPYIGLFGTVWGIMGSFQALGATAQATLATVAPWIAEALVATAIGLFTAIPAVIAYNFLSKKVADLQTRLADLAEELHTLLLTSLHARSHLHMASRESA